MLEQSQNGLLMRDDIQDMRYKASTCSLMSINSNELQEIILKAKNNKNYYNDDIIVEEDANIEQMNYQHADEL